MRHSRAFRALGSALVAMLAVSCGGDDDPTAPILLDFPVLSAQVQAAFCVRGNSTVGDRKSGSITTADCDGAEIDFVEQGYYELYLVKVAGNRTVTFTVSSSFDSFLSLARLDSHTATSVVYTWLATDDDSAGNLDARLSFTLQAGVTYLIFVSGYDYSDIGSYQLTIN